MSDSEKPFACPSPGCNMSFTNEDHLTVHKKKHDMILNLGANGKGNVFVADQTPTPTSFIRNCEEVGLFQDLQNVNPFEETFRRAVETGKCGTLSVSEAGLSDDTLHTPHIFPHIADIQATNIQILSQNGGHEPPVISIKEVPEGETKNATIKVCSGTVSQNSSQSKVKSVKIITTSKETTHTAETIVVQEADTSITTSLRNKRQGTSTPQLSINGEEVQLLLKTADGKLMQLSAAPVIESRNGSNDSGLQSKPQRVVIKTEPSLSCAEKVQSRKSASSRLSLAKMKLKQVLTKNSSVSENQKAPELKRVATASLRENKSRSPEQHKKQDILERNRASSMRARAKRKAWIQHLEKTVNNVNDVNAVLQMEVKALRSEVAKLKTLLLAHKDCPVTKAMERGNGIILEPKVISVNSELLQAVPVTKSVIPVKRPSLASEVPIVPKKKPHLVDMKNAGILPRADTDTGTPIQNAKTVRNVSTIKIIEVGHILADKDGGKQILIVQNQSKNNEGTPRRIIQINPNFEVENAASKSTGS